MLQTGAGKDEEPDAECLVASALTRYNSGERAGFSTGLDFLDTWTGGLVPGRLYVLGATKKTGKTRLAVAAMYGIAAQGGRCSMITLEMTPGEIVDLLNAKMCAINSGRLENRTLTDADKARLSDNATALKTVLDYLRLTAPACLTPDGLEAVIRFHVSLFKVKAIAIDFLTKIIVDTKFENAERGKICSRLSALARELNIAILLVVQLNKTAEQVESPHIGMIEGSGQIAQFADVIFILVNETRTRTDGPGNIAGEQTLKIHITQRQGACSNWLPIRARLQTLDFQSENL
ncbi:MAG: hypothetical protein A2487_14330 [Candidatus Raymondbacteria bacterium RifOxyC12_full_50_8]|nr:MAG: hypothetical protein A2487_14330 [Candidatus Raymondbacteria bacterium RifOxyC12_full_50_8]